MMHKSLIIGLFVLFVTIQCAQADSDTLTYQVDVEQSSLSWSLDIHHGLVKLKSGVVKLQDNRIVDARVVVQMDSVSDQDITYELMRKTLQNILRSDVFFNTKKYPEASFELDQATPLPDGRLLVQGDLTISGVSNCVQFKIRWHKKANTLVVKSEPFYIDRLRWGITSYSQHVAKSSKNFK
jgi:polyisoprenoid-binding protein YceI